MKVSLFKDLRKYSKTKGMIPLDERQMDTLNELYMELAKSVIMGFMLFIITYGFMEMRGQDAGIPFLSLGTCVLGTIAYYYTLRFAYLNVIGLDVNFEMLLVPAMFFTPYLFLHSGFFLLELLPKEYAKYGAIVLMFALPLFFIFTYLGANKVYKNGKAQVEKELQEGELHFRSRNLIVNMVIVLLIFINFLPINYALFFNICILLSTLLTLYNLYHYGIQTPNNDYVLNEKGIRYHRTLWGKKGGFIAYEDIKDVIQQDTFNIGYAKDKIRIEGKNGKNIYLYPENAYRFCMEIKNNL